MHHKIPGCVGLKRFKKDNEKGITFTHVVETLMGRYDIEDIELMAVEARKIWLCKNAVVHRGDFIHPTQIVSKQFI